MSHSSTWAPGLNYRNRHGDGDRDWTLHAACRGHHNPDMWFPGTHQRPSPEAIAICNTVCPVREACRQYARDLHIAYGIWGGLHQRAREEGHR